MEGARGFGNVSASLRGVVEVHFLPATFFAQGAHHGLDFFLGEERGRTERAGADSFFYADDFTAVEAVGRGG